MTTHELKRARKAAAGAFVGTSLEFYDFYIYATASALVFGTIFFPENANPFIGTLAAFAIFGVGFFARPLGAIVIGHIGDRQGRKRALIISLLLMGVATFLIGFVPTYDTIGLWSPAILVVLRLIQGFAIGGEWGGAALISTESAPQGRVNFFGSFTQLGSPAGTVMSSGMFALAGLGGHDVLEEWAWRVPFWFAGVLVIVGLILRARLEESPVFQRAIRDQEQKKLPVVEVFRKEWRSVLAGVLLVAHGIGGFYVTGTLFLSYATQGQGLESSPLLIGQTIAAASSFITFPIVATLADRLGERRVLVVAAILVILFAAPHFLVVGTGNHVLISLMLVVTQTVGAGAWVCIPGFLGRAFAPETRYTGISLSYQLASILFGGILPSVGAAILAVTAGAVLGPVLILVGLAVLVMFGAVFVHRIVKERESA
ncbi:putative MFS family arabinose efflux permease [Tamaricihabitans halophyticus]|uniref:Putative proline/betaine transporter n=1 Tax=Tamaricihabitans halophyticus TaxID=1262583 RepID=A0A4R2Q122_9PSEU|nr:MFS transporter [Tamaricihabitans halophyticus]TCP42069.1 putative MFS family arabinose efflux permease [Tamaricihabitans halophyticus]